MGEEIKKEEIIDEGDTIEVPDELMEIMEAGTEEKPEQEAGDKESSGDPEPSGGVDGKEDATGEDKGEEIENEEEPAPETWKPKHNPEYYKQKGKKTKEHIKDLTTRRYEAEQRALAAEEKAAELEAKLRALSEAQNRPKEDDERIIALNDAIDLAEEDGNSIVAETLKEKRRVLMEGDKPANDNVFQSPKKQQPARPQIDPSAQQWLDDNPWYQEADELGRAKYPQIAAEARYREAALRATMEIGPALYKKLNEEMETTLEAYGLIRANKKKDDDTHSSGIVKEKPRSGLQPSRQGGAEKVKRTGDEGMTDEEHARMVAIFKRTGMDASNPAHRKLFLEQVRS
jgi:hypothetical protein